MRIRALAAAATLSAGLVLTGCGLEFPQPCDDLPKPSARDLQAAKDGYEVERDDGSDTCELTPSGKWELDD
jgi:hypothetical protein